MCHSMKPVPGYEGLYAVCRCGKVWSYIKQRFMKESPMPNGYTHLGLRKDGVTTTFNTHRVVALAYIGGRPEGHHINHINFIRTDNRPENLEYVTPRENLMHSKRHGRVSPPKRKLTDDQVREIRGRCAVNESVSYIAREMKISRDLVSGVINGEAYQDVEGVSPRERHTPSHDDCQGFKDVPGLEGRYAVCPHGKVWSWIQMKILRPNKLTDDGVKWYALMIDNAPTRVTHKELVNLAFMSDKPFKAGFP